MIQCLLGTIRYNNSTMRFSGHHQQQRNHRLLQYFCSKCIILLKETGTDLIENKNSLSASSKSSRTVSKV